METINYCGKDYRIFNLKTSYGEERVFLYAGSYRNNGYLAVEMITTAWEPYAVLTVNMPIGIGADATHAYVDTNNCPWAPAFLEENGLAEDTGVLERSDYCVYPLYKFDTSKFTA